MDHFVLIVLWVFGLVCLFLSQLREVMRQVRLTAQEWRATIYDTGFRGRESPFATSPTEASQAPPRATPREAGERPAPEELVDPVVGISKDGPDDNCAGCE